MRKRYVVATESSSSLLVAWTAWRLPRFTVSDEEDKLKQGFQDRKTHTKFSIPQPSLCAHRILNAWNFWTFLPTTVVDHPPALWNSAAFGFHNVFFSPSLVWLPPGFVQHPGLHQYGQGHGCRDSLQLGAWWHGGFDGPPRAQEREGQEAGEGPKHRGQGQGC